MKELRNTSTESPVDFLKEPAPHKGNNKKKGIEEVVFQLSDRQNESTQTWNSIRGFAFGVPSGFAFQGFDQIMGHLFNLNTSVDAPLFFLPVAKKNMEFVHTRFL